MKGPKGFPTQFKGCVDSSPLLFLLKFDCTYSRPLLKACLLDGLDSRPGINKLGSRSLNRARERGPGGGAQNPRIAFFIKRHSNADIIGQGPCVLMAVEALARFPLPRIIWE